MRRVYRDTRLGLIPTTDGTRLVYMLQVLARLTESGPPTLQGGDCLAGNDAPSSLQETDLWLRRLVAPNGT